jgi:transposase
MREIINGIFYVMRAGCPWRLLPSDLPPWSTIYRWFATFRDASAGIACVGLVCWHVQDTYEYPSESRVVVHKDDWKWGPSEKYSWREHEVRGYWKGDSWTDWK